jgi:hypothetical protein
MAFATAIWGPKRPAQPATPGVSVQHVALEVLLVAAPPPPPPQILSITTSVASRFIVTATATNAVGPVTWEWGDGVVETVDGITAQHTYLFGRDWPISATDAIGSVGNTSVTIVEPDDRDGPFNFWILQDVPFEVYFGISQMSGQVAPSNPVVVIHGDGTGQQATAGSYPTHTYPGPGTYLAECRDATYKRESVTLVFAENGSCTQSGDPVQTMKEGVS